MTEEAWMTFMPDGTDDDVWYTNPEGKLPEGYTYQKLNPNWSKEMAQPEQEPVAWATKEDFYRELERELKHIREEMKIKSVTMRCKDYDIALPIIGTDFGRVLVGQVSTPPQRKPLTRERLVEMAYAQCGLERTFEDWVELFAREIEAAHGIKE